MTDIVERLRADAEMSRDCSSNWEAFDCSEAMREAADEIERLRLSISETEDNTLLGYIADIRQKSGVGVKPMLSELADAIATALSEARATVRREGLSEAAEIAENCGPLPKGSWMFASEEHTARLVAAAIRAAMEK